VSKSNENEEIGVENDEFYSSFKKYKQKHLQKNKIKRKIKRFSPTQHKIIFV
jgi:hypothetical protein